MKKIITVLMVLMVAASMFAEEKILFNNKIEERVAYANTSYKQVDFPKITTEEELLYIADEVSKNIETIEKKFEFITYDLVELDEYAKEYNFYYIADNKLYWLIYFIKISDETQAVIYYKVKQAN